MVRGDGKTVGGLAGAVRAVVLRVGPGPTLAVRLTGSHRVVERVRVGTVFGLRGPWSAEALQELLDDVDTVVLRARGLETDGSMRVDVSVDLGRAREVA